MGLLEDKVVVVTGAGRGIGRGEAVECARQGAAVVVAEFDPEVGEEAAAEITAAGGRAVAVPGDVSDSDVAEKLVAIAVETFGGLDGLVNNAGILRDRLLVKKDRTTGQIAKMSREEWQAVIDVNLTGATFMARDVVAKMLAHEQPPGVIVNISSIARHGNRGQSNYVSAKASLAANTVTWSREFAPLGIRVGAVAPGMIETPMTRGMNQKARDAAVAAIPVGRIGEPEDIWLAVKFILECDFFNGRTIDVDGGMSF
jgi:3-oxoacyl-[acyl-carrier protein] reductase